MRITTFLGTIALLSACTKNAAPPEAPQAATAASASTERPASVQQVLNATGFGALRFGMTLAQAEQATGAKAVLPTPFDPACSMVRFPTMPALRFMVESDIVTRADAEPGVGNAVGVAVGDTLAQLRARHPEAKVTPHKYDEQGHYVRFPSADGRAAIVMEESGGKVTKIRAGLQPAVDYVETCL